jgi:hypothetical protein
MQTARDAAAIRFEYGLFAGPKVQERALTQRFGQNLQCRRFGGIEPARGQFNDSTRPSRKFEVDPDFLLAADGEQHRVAAVRNIEMKAAVMKPRLSIRLHIDAHIRHRGIEIARQPFAHDRRFGTVARIGPARKEPHMNFTIVQRRRLGLRYEMFVGQEAHTRSFGAVATIGQAFLHQCRKRDGSATRIVLSADVLESS